MMQLDTPIAQCGEFYKAVTFVKIDGKETQQLLDKIGCQGSEDGCRELVRHGADVEYADTRDIMALHATAKIGSYECEQLLLEWETPRTWTNQYSRTAVWHAG